MYRGTLVLLRQQANEGTVLARDNPSRRAGQPQAADPLCIVERKSYCDNRRAKGLRWRRTIRAAEQAAVWLQSTVCRGMLSEMQTVEKKLKRNSLNPLYVVECFRRELSIKENAKLMVLIHCMSWNAFGE